MLINHPNTNGGCHAEGRCESRPSLMVEQGVHRPPSINADIVLRCETANLTTDHVSHVLDGCPQADAYPSNPQAPRISQRFTRSWPMGIVPDEYSEKLHPREPDFWQARHYFLDAYCIQQFSILVSMYHSSVVTRKCHTVQMSSCQYRDNSSLHPNTAPSPDNFMASIACIGHSLRSLSQTMSTIAAVPTQSKPHAHSKAIIDLWPLVLQQCFPSQADLFRIGIPHQCRLGPMIYPDVLWMIHLRKL